MEAHRQIVDALCQRDSEAARAGIARDIGDAAQSLIERLQVRDEVGGKQASR
jgi:DNA-binding GntR family transcriptional regulator